MMVVSILVQLAEATTMNFTVHGGEEVTKSLSLAVEDRIVIKFSVVGQTDNVLDFFMACPNGTVKDFGRVGTFSYPFICYDAGEYVLHFSNRFFRR
jgi:hypothetical protein